VGGAHKVRRGWACRHVEPAEVIARDRRAATGTVGLEATCLEAVLATGSPAAQTFLRAWVSRIEAEGLKLAVALTLTGELAGSAANNGYFDGATESLRPAENSDPSGIRTRVAEMKTRSPDPWTMGSQGDGAAEGGWVAEDSNL
jgi:hypothetical protein